MQADVIGGHLPVIQWKSVINMDELAINIRSFNGS
jgi:hypothetical protein